MKELSYRDLRRIVKNHGRALLTSALLLGSFALGLRLLRQPLYISQALFIDAKKGEAGEGAIFKKIGLKSLGVSSYEGHALLGFQSHKVLAPVVDKLGLSVVLPRERWVARAWNNLKSECKRPLSPPEGFDFSDLEFRGEESPELTLVFLKSGAFSVRDKAGITLTLGKVGEICDAGYLRFRLKRLPRKLPKVFALRFRPRLEVIQEVKKRLVVEPVKEDPQLIRCRFAARDRQKAHDFLVHLFSVYEKQLDCDSEDKSARDQIFLEQRRDQLLTTFEKDLSHYLGHLEESIEKGGYFSTEKEIKAKYVERRALETASFEIAQERAQLEGPLEALSLPYTPFSQKIDRLIAQRSDLEKRKESLRRDLSPIKSLKVALHVPKNREEGVIDRLEAEKFFAHYQQQRDQLQGELSHFDYLLRDFSFQKAQNLLGSHKWIDEGLLLQRLMRDDSHFSDLERRRYQKEVEHLQEIIQEEAVEKRATLLQQLALTQTKIDELQEALIAQIDKEMAICDDQLYATVALRKAMLDRERRHIETHLDHIKEEIAKLPTKWESEKQLALKTELNRGMMANLTQLIESKRVEDHLRRSESRPFDPPFLPLKPQPPFLFFYALLGALLGCLSHFLLLVLKEVHDA